MLPNSKSIKCIAGMAAALLAIFFMPHGPALSYEFDGWDRGAMGYEVSRIYAKDNYKPLLLYFHKGSEEWSEKVNNDYLSDPEIDAFISDIPRAEINPEEGQDERALAKEYKVENPPAIFVLMPASMVEPQEIKPFAEENNMTAEDFLMSVRGAIIYLYNETALESFEKKDYSGALAFLEIALGYDPKRAYSYYAMGVIYHVLGIQDKDPVQIEKAEENYIKALDLDPEYEKAKDQLKTLREDKLKMGIQ